jgi:HAD superfamily hydrolase (TIGR01509 family)
MTAFLFDMDGVIIDSMPMHTLAWQAYLDRHGIDSANLVSRMHGRRNDELVFEFWGPELPPEENFRHGAAKEALYREMMDTVFDRHLVPGAVDFVRKLAAAPKGLGSNAERANIDFTLHRARLAAEFSHVVDGNQVERPKPYPDIYLKLAQLLQVEPAQCIVFEDSPTGVRAARAAGMRVVGVDTGRVGLENVDLRILDFDDPQLRPWLSREGCEVLA